MKMSHVLDNVLFTGYSRSSRWGASLWRHHFLSWFSHSEGGVSVCKVAIGGEMVYMQGAYLRVLRS